MKSNASTGDTVSGGEQGGGVMRGSTFRLAGVQPGELACVVVVLTEARHQVGGHLAFAGGWLSLELFPATGPTHSSEANTALYQDSEFLGQAFRLAATDGILGIVSFSDLPQARHGALITS
jgi:hypothetical protein